MDYDPKAEITAYSESFRIDPSTARNRLGVTFAARNRWINDRAAPRPKAVERIDDLYKEYSGEKQVPTSVLAAKYGIIRKKQKQHPHILKEILNSPDIRDQFYLSLTYHSNRIEGSTLSEGENGRYHVPERGATKQEHY